MTYRNSKNIICATTSPRRISLLRKSFHHIKFITPVYKERKRKYFFSPILLSIYYAYKKAENIKNDNNEFVISFDTIVYRKFKIYNKPDNKEHAVKILKELSNRTHKVVTGVCIKYNNKTRFFYEISKVKFKKLSDKEILAYIKTNEWKDKAGGYGIQGKGYNPVQWYQGDYYNIVGIPINLVLRLLKS